MTRVKAHYQRSLKGRRYRVKAYTRRPRKKGNKFRYKDVGRYQVRFDEYGNFRGSRIIKTRPKKRTRRTTRKK